MSPKSTSPFAPLPSGEELYDTLMAQIEPELTREGLETLEEKYRDETPAQAAARSERYEKAFAAYEKKLDEYIGQRKAEVTTYRHQALKTMEHDDTEAEAPILSALEDSISAA